MSGKRDRLLADALHEAAVASDGISVVIHDLIVIALVEQPLGERHADRVAKPLPQRPGGGLDARRMAIFRMARRARAELAEALELLDVHARNAGEIEKRIEQHGAMTGGQHEAVAVRPFRMHGVEFQEACEQHRGHVGHAHGHAGMAGIGLLHRIHGERPDGVRHVLVGRLG